MDAAADTATDGASRNPYAVPDPAAYSNPYARPADPYVGSGDAHADTCTPDPCSDGWNVPADPADPATADALSDG